MESMTRFRYSAKRTSYAMILAKTSLTDSTLRYLSLSFVILGERAISLSLTEDHGVIQNGRRSLHLDLSSQIIKTMKFSSISATAVLAVSNVLAFGEPDLKVERAGGVFSLRKASVDSGVINNGTPAGQTVMIGNGMSRSESGEKADKR